MDMRVHFLPARTNSLILENTLLLPRGLSCSQPSLSVSASVDDIMNIQHEIAVERLPLWCFGGALALIERSRKLSQQLLNEPFDEVKVQMVRLRRVVDGISTDLFALKADGTASRSLVADFLSEAHDDADEETMKAVALMGYMGKSFFTRTEFIH